MATYTNEVTNERKEASAIAVMRTMLLGYAEEKHIPFEQALMEFAESKTYEALFDFETGFWREGPTYLRAWYDEEIQPQSEYYA